MLAYWGYALLIGAMILANAVQLLCHWLKASLCSRHLQFPQQHLLP